MDNFDIYISNIISKKIYEPPKYKNTIEKTLKEYTNNRCSIINYILKTIAIIVTSISLIGGCAYAIKILCNINLNSNEQKNNDSFTTNSDYVQILNMSYQTVDDLSIKINSILLDDFKLELNIDYLYKKPITSADSKMIVKDEKGNILYKNDIVIDNASQAVDRNTFIKNNKISYGIIYNQDTVEEKKKQKYLM